LIGQAVRGRRDGVTLATKVGAPMSESPFERGLSRRWLMRAVENSLRRLETDYIDLYQAHFPDPGTPVEETLRAMDDMVRQGKVRYLGCSNHAAWQLTYAVGISERLGLNRWISVQPYFNLLVELSDPTLIDACRALGVGVIPYRPLASGILTGKYRSGEEPAPGTRAGDLSFIRKEVTDARLVVVERLRAWAEERGHTSAELAIAWLLAHPEVSTVIVGARRPEQVDANVRAVQWKLTPEMRDEVSALAKMPA
jgi:aryl-alcohol dehydrogenase-like predicted oxidoreductase